MISQNLDICNIHIYVKETVSYLLSLSVYLLYLFTYFCLKLLVI